jgi:hypothetical protein
VLGNLKSEDDDMSRSVLDNASVLILDFEIVVPCFLILKFSKFPLINNVHPV